MTTTHEADIICDALRSAARKAHIVPGLDHDCSLLSIGTLFDADYTVTFHKKHMKVYDSTVNGKDTLVLIGHRNPTNGRWHVDLAHPTIHMANAIGDPMTADLVAFAHASLFPPRPLYIGGCPCQRIPHEFPWTNPQGASQIPASVHRHAQRPPGPNSEEPTIDEETRRHRNSEYGNKTNRT
jgi:hypothetical protein